MAKAVFKKAMHASQLLNEPIEYGKSFSRGLRVEVGDATILFISGTASIDAKGNSHRPGDFSAQAKRTFYNITALLRSEGANWHDIIQTRCYLKDMRDYDKFNELRNKFYKKKQLKPFPASVCIEANLCRQELLVEIEALAMIRGTSRSKKKG